MNIGRYEILQELGHGGMAVVYLARDPLMDRQVALKLLPRPAGTGDEQFRIRFEREARIVAALEHPAIVPVYDFGYFENRPFLVMRYMSGGTLNDRLKDNPLPLNEILQVLEQLAPAMDFVHSKGIIHRDLKPTNILFDQTGNAFLADFGIAKISEASTELTGSATIGTPAYMSPEQAKGGSPLDARSDIYSMGVILYKMLTGHVPFEGDTPISQAVAHIIQPIPDILSLRPDLPKPYKGLLNRVLAKEPKERFDTMSDLLRELERAEQARHPDVKSTPELPKTIASLSDNKQPTLQLKGNRQPHIPRWVILVGSGLGFIFVILLAFIAYRLTTNLQFTAITSTPLAQVSTSVLTSKPPTETSIPQQTLTPSLAPTLSPSPTITPDPNFIVDEFGIPMIRIPAGSFQMGSSADVAFAECQKYRTDCNLEDFTYEEPVHSVYLDTFFIDQYEITNSQYTVFLAASGNQDESGATWLNDNENSHIHLADNIWHVDTGFENHPVIFVTWYGAQAYCEWRGTVLPSEAQWEKAARGGLEGALYPWGNDMPVCDSVGNNGAQYNACGGSTVPVGSFAPNGYGLYDMAGNVYEWVEDWFSDSYYSVSPQTNPSGPEGEFDRRVMRGGSWSLSANNLRVATRGRNLPENSFRGVGFRCASLP